MRQRVKVPPLGDGVTSATVLEWVIGIGDTVAAGQSLLSVELDKVDADVPSPVGGTLVERAAEEGDEIQVGDVLCVIET